MAQKVCARCGAPMEGSVNPKCPATGSNHKFDRITHERAMEAERKKTEAKQ